MNPTDPLGPELLGEIEAYYDGELSDDAAGRLRERLRDDPALAAAVAEWEKVYRVGLTPSAEDLRDREELRTKFSAIATSRPAAEATVRKISSRAWLAAAAGVLILLAAAWWVFLRPADPAAQLAEENFVWLPREGATLGPREDAESGLVAYDLQEYARAYPLLIEGVANGQLDSVNLLYAGVAALGADLPREARQALTDLLETGRYPLEEGELRYYLALAELQGGDAGAAASRLSEQTDPVDRNQALLEKIRGLR